jgi:hypothetical protein
MAEFLSQASFKNNFTANLKSTLDRIYCFREVSRRYLGRAKNLRRNLVVLVEREQQIMIKVTNDKLKSNKKLKKFSESLVALNQERVNAVCGLWA